MTLSGLGTSDAGMLSDVFMGLLFGLLMGVPAAFFGIAIVGFPMYFLLLRFNVLRLWSACAVGGLVGFLIFFDSAPMRITLGGLLTGCAVGALAYVLRPTKDEIESKCNGAKPAEAAGPAAND
ncbi:hypothetical protein ACL9RI_03265 [Janthinobacterium sp. Mn2066]|uniref:hypothetical protein n=1 Tax=Janthinobacterium sp. Mn2066 TaxID=3395264 RepID=UPI003BDC0456